MSEREEQLRADIFAEKQAIAELRAHMEEAILERDRFEQLMQTAKSKLALAQRELRLMRQAFSAIAAIIRAQENSE